MASMPPRSPSATRPRSGVWASPRSPTQLPWLKSRMLVASLAGPVGTLAGLGDKGPAVADAFAEELGLGAAPIAWHARRARMAEAGAWLAILIGALAKMAMDVAHLASTEVGEVAEPYVPGRGGSSAMPHKRNPVSSTVILAAHAGAPVMSTTLLTAMAAAHERPAGLWHAEWHALAAALRARLRRAARGARARRRAGGRRRPDAGQHRRHPRPAVRRCGGRALRAAARARGGTYSRRTRRRRGARHGRVLARRCWRTIPPSRSPAQTQILDAAFDLTPSVEAAAGWTDRAVAAADRIRERLSSSEG